MTFIKIRKESNRGIQTQEGSRTVKLPEFDMNQSDEFRDIQMTQNDFKKTSGIIQNKDLQDIMQSKINSGPPSTMMNFFNEIAQNN